MRSRNFLPLIGLLALIMAACQAAPGSVPENRLDSGGADLTRIHESNGVRVAVTPLNLNTPGDTLEFEVALDTHTRDLDFDLAALAFLRTDRGEEVRALAWDGGRGGHHLRGRLFFPSRDPTGLALIREGVHVLELILRDVDGAPEHSFRWEVSP
ncbi:hypothetical protein [Thermoflexus sp.]|uniref:hypothetical protein n=1 Tax=Thermoflexus sp. TaxID=1969742 RepID=UPI0035E432E0